jgi:hypothetical protein
MYKTIELQNNPKGIMVLCSKFAFEARIWVFEKAPVFLSQ